MGMDVWIWMGGNTFLGPFEGVGPEKSLVLDFPPSKSIRPTPYTYTTGTLLVNNLADISSIFPIPMFATSPPADPDTSILNSALSVKPFLI